MKPIDPTKRYEGDPCAKCGGAWRYKNNNVCCKCASVRAANTRWCATNFPTARSQTTLADKRWLTGTAQADKKGYAAPPHESEVPPRPKVCDCCGRPSNYKSKDGMNTKVLSLDHDHVTGEFRGWLCQGCNQGIGLLGDTPHGVKQALAYLNRFFAKMGHSG